MFEDVSSSRHAGGFILPMALPFFWNRLMVLNNLLAYVTVKPHSAPAITISCSELGHFSRRVCMGEYFLQRGGLQFDRVLNRRHGCATGKRRRYLQGRFAGTQFEVFPWLNEFDFTPLLQALSFAQFPAEALPEKQWWADFFKRLEKTDWLCRRAICRADFAGKPGEPSSKRLWMYARHQWRILRASVC